MAREYVYYGVCCEGGHANKVPLDGFVKKVIDPKLQSVIQGKWLDVVVYNRELTDEELIEYSMERIGAVRLDVKIEDALESITAVRLEEMGNGKSAE